MPSSSSSSDRQRRERRPRRNRNNENDPDAAFKEQIKAERRAQVMHQNDASEPTAGNSGAAIGDGMVASNVASVPRERGSDGSSSRNRGRRHNRPAKGPSKSAPSQVGAVAATGRAFGAPRRPPTNRNNMTRSIAGDGHYESDNDEEAQPRHPKEAVAMGAMTVEDHEREKRRRQKVQAEASRLTREIRNESRSNEEMAFAVAKEEDDGDDAKEADHSKSKDDHEDSLAAARRWKSIAICLCCSVIVVVGVALGLATRQQSLAQNQVDDGFIAGPDQNQEDYDDSIVRPDENILSEADCERIANGRLVEGQGDLDVLPAAVELMVVVPFSGTPVLEELEQKLQTNLIPTVLGCPGYDYYDRTKDDVFRYWIANALVDNVEQTDSSACPRNGLEWYCIQVKVSLQVFLVAEDAPNNMIIDSIAGIFQDENLSPTLDLASPVGRIEFLGAYETALPSSAPTYFVYDRPDQQECERIANGLPTIGQDDMPQLTFFLDFEVEMQLEVDMDLYLPTLEDKLKNRLVPSLVGCPDEDGEDGAFLSDWSDPYRYVVGNALVVNVKQNGSDACESDKIEPCYRVSVDLQVFLRGDDARIVNLIVVIAEAIGEDPVSTLELGAPFRKLAIVIIGSIDPTAAPSIYPTLAPVSFPTTQNPTTVPTPGPSVPASANPTIALQ